MRWYWIDRLLEFHSGKYAKAVKHVSLTDDHLHDHMPGFPVMPATLVIEGLTQTAGLLLAEHSRFTQAIILAKVSKAAFYRDVIPGSTLTYTVRPLSITAQGALMQGTSHVGEELQAELEIVLAYPNHAPPGQTVFDPTVFLEMMRVLGGFEVGRAADGTRLVDPAVLSGPHNAH